MIYQSTIINKSFDERLKYGRETEDRALVLVKKNIDSKAYLILGEDKGKDIVAPSVGLTFEVKDQRTAIVCLSVEFARKSKGGEWRKSAIGRTIADYWIWFCKDQFLVISNKNLKELAQYKPIKIYPHRNEEYAMKIVTIKEVMDKAKYIWFDR